MNNTIKTELTEEDRKVLAVFPVGTVIESTIGLGGGTEVFIGSMHVQPFSYLDDYDVSHYKVVDDE